MVTHKDSAIGTWVGKQGAKVQEGWGVGGRLVTRKSSAIDTQVSR